MQQGVPITIPVNITDCESRISFVLLWEDPAAQIQFTVRAPDGTTFGAGSGAANRLVRYVQRPGYRFFQITLPPGPTRTIGPRQLGQWQMLIDPVHVTGGTTRISTSVLVESELEITAQITGARRGRPDVRARRADPRRLGGADRERERAAHRAADLARPAVHARCSAARRRRRHPPHPAGAADPDEDPHHALRGPLRQAPYTAQLPVPEIDGVYHAEITATGQACGGMFERYWSGSVYVGSLKTPR